MATGLVGIVSKNTLTFSTICPSKIILTGTSSSTYILTINTIAFTIQTGAVNLSFYGGAGQMFTITSSAEGLVVIVSVLEETI